MFCLHGKLKRNCVLCMQRESLKIQQAQLEMAKFNFQQERANQGQFPDFDMPTKKRRRPHVFRWIALGLVVLVIASDWRVSPFVVPVLGVGIVLWGLWLWRRHRGDGVSLDADDEPATKKQNIEGRGGRNG